MGIEINEGGWAWEGVQTVLQRRGHLIASSDSKAGSLFSHQRFPEMALQQTYGPREAQRILGTNRFSRFVEVYGWNATRNLLRHLLSAPDRTMSTSAIEKLCGRRTGPILEYLDATGTVDIRIDTVRLIRPDFDIALSLEQYVAMMCMSELRGHAMWSVKLEGVSSGDFDTLAWLPPTLVYFECKSGRVANIESTSLSKMLERIHDVAPDLAILVLDTDESLEPLHRMIRECSPFAFSLGDMFPQAHYGGILYGQYAFWPLYVINSRPSILTNVRRCLRHYHSLGRWGWNDFTVLGHKR